MEHWYVYYACPPEAVLETIKRAQLMQDRLFASHGAVGRLVQSVGTGNRTTLMEIYEHIDQPERFSVALEEALVDSGLAALHDTRHIERFRDV